jgi:hypothetical protein
MTPGYFSTSGGIGSAWGQVVPAHAPEAGGGAPPGQDVERYARLTAERLRTLVAGGTLRFPPWFNHTGETREMRRAYREMVAEPTLKAAVLTKALAVSQLDLQVHAWNPDDPREVEANVEFGGYVLRRVRGGTSRVVFNLLFPGLFDGWSLVEPKWAPITNGRWAGKWGWECVKSKDVRHVTPLVDGFLNVEGIRSHVGGQGGHVFDPADFLRWVHLPLFENPFGLSDFRAAFRAYWIKTVAWELRAQGLDRWVHPALLAQYTDEGQHRQALEAALANYRANGWLTVPTGVLIQALQVARSGESDFKSAIADLDQEMCIGVLGAFLQTLTGQVTDARGSAAVQKSTTELFMWSLAGDMSSVLTEHGLAPLVRTNFAGVEPGYCTLGAVNEGDLKAYIDNCKALQEIGLVLSRKELYRTTARSQPVDGGDALAPAAKPPPGGNGTGGGAAGGPPAPPFAETFAEGEGGDDTAGHAGRPAGADESDATDVDEQAELIAEILYGVFGAAAAGSYDHAEGAAAFADFDALHHPRGPDGRFIPKGSAEAVGAAKEKIGALRGKPATDANVAELASHLHILTVKQLRELHRQHGLKIPGRLRAQLVEGVKAQLLAAAGKEPEEKAPAAPAPAGGVVTDDTPLRAGLNPPGWPVSTTLKDLRDFARQRLGKRFHSVVVRKYGGGSQVEVLGVKEGYHGRQTFLAATYPHIGQPGPKPPAVSAPAQKLPREDEARAQYDRERQLEGSPRRFDAVVAELRKAGGTDKDVQDVIDLYAPERKAPAGPPHADPARLPTDAELAAGVGKRLGAGESLHSAGMNRITLPDGRVVYHKPLKPDDVRREVLVSQLAALAGAGVPAARAASYDGNDGVLTAGVPGETLAEAWAGLGRMRPVESLKLDPGDVARHVLTGYLLDLRDRHAGNYLVGEPGPGGRRPVTSIDHEFSLTVAGPREAANKVLMSDLISQARPTDLPPAVVKAVAAAVPGMVAHLKAAGMGKEASAVAFRGEALARLAAEPKPDTQKLLEHATAVQEGKGRR